MIWASFSQVRNDARFSRQTCLASWLLDCYSDYGYLQNIPCIMSVCFNHQRLCNSNMSEHIYFAQSYFLTGLCGCALIFFSAYEYMHSIITKFDKISFFRQCLVIMTERRFRARTRTKSIPAHRDHRNACFSAFTIQSTGRRIQSFMRSECPTHTALAHSPFFPNPHMIDALYSQRFSRMATYHINTILMMPRMSVVTTLAPSSEYLERR
jgi:hypothetical protein